MESSGPGRNESDSDKLEDEGVETEVQSDSPEVMAEADAQEAEVCVFHHVRVTQVTNS